MVKKSKYNIRLWAGILFAQFLLFYLISKNQILVFLFVKFFHIKQDLHERIFSKVPFSIGDLLYVILIIYFVFTAFKILKKSEKQNSIQRLLMIINLFYFVYQISWGMLYFDKPLADKLSQNKVNFNEIKAITLEYIKLTNEERKKLSEDKKGAFKIENISSLQNEILKTQKLIPTKFYSYKTSSANNFKPSIFGHAMSYTGILGYYNPFTSEAQYNGNIPATFIPFTLSHESAHQMGFAREQEASFIAYIICEKSKNPELRYSAYLYTTKRLLNYLFDCDPIFASKAKLLFSEKVKKDLEHDKKFTQENSGFLESLFLSLNDWFLKSNQQEGAITYSYYLELFLKYKNSPSS
jgi:hypothetical protein